MQFTITKERKDIARWDAKGFDFTLSSWTLIWETAA